CFFTQNTLKTMLFIRVFRVALYPRPEGRGFTASLINSLFSKFYI
ncbi:MAG: hypothetical protein RLZZ210_59, partial [Pseudomonadota bacterium]